eukprot:1434544-Rhodomonas_salina.1
MSEFTETLSVVPPSIIATMLGADVTTMSKVLEAVRVPSVEEVAVNTKSLAPDTFVQEKSKDALLMEQLENLASPLIEMVSDTLYDSCTKT